MFGISYFGIEYFHENYFGPVEPVIGGRKKKLSPEDVKTLELIYGGIEPSIETVLEPTLEPALETVEEFEDIALILAIAEATEKNTYYTV